jgi:hypothetical protein
LRLRYALLALFGMAGVAIPTLWLAEMVWGDWDIPSQPSRPPWGSTSVDEAPIYWGAANVFIENRSGKPARLVQRAVLCERPGDPCGSWTMDLFLPAEGGRSPAWTRFFLQAGTSRVTLAFVDEQGGSLQDITVTVDLARGIECDVHVTLQGDRILTTSCKPRGPFSTTSF